MEIEITAFHPDRKGIRKVLGDLEAEITELIMSVQEENENETPNTLEYE